MRYVWGYNAKVWHDTHHLGERCNTDAIKDRRTDDVTPLKKRLCKWCAAQAAKEARDGRDGVEP